MTKPVALIIMDGWGIRMRELGNAVVLGKTPNYDYWQKNFEMSILDASGEEVGLTAGQMGNSEVGHLNIGAGFIVEQEILRIDKSIRTDVFFQHPILKAAAEKAKKDKVNVHLFGLLGPGGVHSHDRHLLALLKFFKDKAIHPLVHVITDGRDTPPRSGIKHLEALQAAMKTLSGRIVTVSGRYYAMDRDNRWERTKLAYDTYCYRQGKQANTPEQAIQQSYDSDVADEFILPTIVGSAEDGYTVENGDVLIFYNFRADRMRQIVRSFSAPKFDSFERKELKDLKVISCTEYDAEFKKVEVLFPSKNIEKPIARVLSDNKLTQFHAAETEKYAHVTYFFNGGREEPFPGEERMLVPSPKVATYDLQPEMSAYELTEKILERIKTHKDDFLVINFANPDMVGHTGILEAAIKAVETVDACTGKVVEAILAKGGAVAITSDHGNSELMIDVINNSPHTYHTIDPVPFIVVSNQKTYAMRPRGILADIAPTILALLGIEKPAEMTGQSLIQNL